MRREIIEDLINWKESKDRKPLIVHGVRQVGKIVELLKDKITLIILLIILVLISLVQVRMSKKRLRRKEKRYEYNKKCNSLKKYSNK